MSTRRETSSRKTPRRKTKPKPKSLPDEATQKRNKSVPEEISVAGSKTLPSPASMPDEPTRKMSKAPNEDSKTEVMTSRAPKSKSPVQEIVKLIGRERPDLVEDLITMEREAHSFAAEKLKTELATQQQRMDNLIRKVQQLVEEQQHSSERFHQDLAANKKQFDKINAQNDELLQLRERDIEELRQDRSRLTEELKQLRENYNQAVTEQRKAASESEGRMGKMQHEFLEREKGLDLRMLELDGKRAELKNQLREALASRDRLGEQSKELASKVESILIPLRNEAEGLKADKKRLQSELKEGKAKIKTLEMVIGGPAHSSS